MMTSIARIETERLTLTPFTLEDIPALFEIAREKESIEDFQVAAETIDDVRTWLEPDSHDPDTLRWVIRKNGCVIGFFEAAPGAEYSDVEANVCNIGYFLEWREQGQGLTTEAMRGVVQWLFAETGIERIEAGVTLHNVASYRVLEKVGFIREKVVEKNWKWRDQFYDSAYYYLLKSPAGHAVE